MNDVYSDIYIVAFLLLATSAGGAVGTGALVMWLLSSFSRERQRLEQRVQELQAQYRALIDYMVQERYMSQATAEQIKKTGPLTLHNELHVGGDAVGRDKSG